jgi:hypothetical protein
VRRVVPLQIRSHELLIRVFSFGDAGVGGCGGIQNRSLIAISRDPVKLKGTDDPCANAAARCEKSIEVAWRDVAILEAVRSRRSPRKCGDMVADDPIAPQVPM